MISGLTREDRGLRLYLEETPVPDAIDAPIYTRLLDEFQGYSHEGFLMHLEPKKLAHLEAAASRSTLYVRDATGLGNTLLRAGMNEHIVRKFLILFCYKRFSNYKIKIFFLIVACA